MMYEYYLYCCEPHNALYLAGAIYHSRYDPRYEHLKPFDAVTVVEDLERHIAGSPAMSRIDGSDICPECGVREAMEAFDSSQQS